MALNAALVSAEIDRPLGVCESLRHVSASSRSDDLEIEGRLFSIDSQLVLAETGCPDHTVEHLGSSSWPSGILLDVDDTVRVRSPPPCQGRSVARATVRGRLEGAKSYRLKHSNVFKGTGFGRDGVFPAKIDAPDFIEVECYQIPVLDFCDLFDLPESERTMTVAVRATLWNLGRWFALSGDCTEDFALQWARSPRAALVKEGTSLSEPHSFPLDLVEGLVTNPAGLDAWDGFVYKEQPEVVALEGVFIGVLRISEESPPVCTDLGPGVVGNQWIQAEFHLESVWSGESKTYESEIAEREWVARREQFNCTEQSGPSHQ